MFKKDQNNNKNSYSKMAGESTRTIVADYIKHRLQVQVNYVWDNGQQDDVPLTKTQSAMRQLGDEFEENFRARFDNMIQRLSEHLRTDNAHETFRAIVNEIFDDGVHWGRLVALFGFAAKFSVLCFQKDMIEVIDLVVDWVTSYVDNELSNWMTSKNGWRGFLQFFEDGPGARQENNWPNIRTIGGYALAGMGIITLGAFLTQRT